MLLRNNVLLFFVATAFGERIAEIPHVDHVIDRLSRQEWDKDEVRCRDKIFSVLQNVKNSTLWATWIWDSNPQAPSGTFYGARFHLGNYDQCLRPPWLSKNPELRTQYCFADIEMSKDPSVKNWDLPGPYERAEEYYVKGATFAGRSFSFMSYGVCLPVECQIKSTKKFVKALLSVQHLQAAWDSEVKIHHCEEAGARRVPPRGYYVYMYTFAALAFMAIVSTYYISNYPETASSSTFVNHVVKSFCLRRNWAAVFKDDKDALPCIHGIKCLSAVFVAFGHVSMHTQAASISNAIDFDQTMLSYNRSMLAVHFDLSVDTFFAISALLLGYFLSTIRVDLTKPYHLHVAILKRYIRLLGPLAVIVFYVAYVLMQNDSGPLYPKVIKQQQEACQQNWLPALLMVGNYINIEGMCHPPTWYIPCDFHFYVITLVLLYVYQKNQKVGKIATAVVLFLGFLGPGISTYVYDLPALSAVWTFSTGFNVNNVRTNKNFKAYIQTHNRMGPYVAGLLVGYMMSLYKPADYKKIWSQTTSFIGILASLMLMVAVHIVGAICYKHRIHGLLACLYMMLDRFTFATSFLFIVIFCTYGDVPIINSFLCWAPFKPLSRLFYGVYLIQVVLISRSKMALRNHTRYNGPDMVVEAFGLLVVSLILSLIVWLLVEAPLINFTNRYFYIRLETKINTNDVANETSENVLAGGNIEDKQKVI